MLDKIADWTYKPFFAYPDKLERFVYLLIFLFPTVGMSVNHWISNIYAALILIGLFSLRKEREPLLKQEKIFLWICAAYFSMFIVAGLANGWAPIQTHELGTETRFLFVIPIYLLLRRYADCSLWLLRGSIFGGFFLFAQAYYDVAVVGHPTALGIASKNILGPFAVLTAFWSLYYFWQNRSRFHWILLTIIMTSVVGALVAAGLAGSRGGYVGFLATGLFCIMFFSRPRWMFASLAVMLVTVMMFYQKMDIVQRGVDTAVNETIQYFKAEDHVKDASSRTSTGVRLEMLRTGTILIADSPIVGIGSGNYHATIKKYISSGMSHPILDKFHYSHNAFLETAVNKGLLGLVTLLLLFYYPAYVYIKNYKICKPSAALGLIHIVAISAFSLTDHSVLLMNNYTSITLLGIAIFFSSHIRACKKYMNHG